MRHFSHEIVLEKSGFGCGLMSFCLQQNWFLDLKNILYLRCKEQALVDVPCCYRYYPGQQVYVFL